MKVVFAILGILAALAIAVSLAWFYHRFEEFSDDFLVWVSSTGPKGERRTRAASRRVRGDSEASRRLTRPAPLIDCVTLGSPMYSTEPAPDRPILSVFSDHPRFDEQHVVRRDRMAMRAVDEPPATARDDVYLVARVRLLGIGAARCV